MLYSRVAGWGRKKSPTGNIFQLETLFVPININRTHWTVAVVHFRQQTITYLDSLGAPGHSHLIRILRYIQQEHNQIYQLPLLEGWMVRTCPLTVPRQHNNHDCGAYMCLFADQIIRGMPLRATETNIRLFLKHLILGILVVHNSASLY
jgi:sentrin-specific protease 1